MSIQSLGTREFNKQIQAALNSNVKVELEFENRYYIGRLIGIDMNTLSVCLEAAKDEKNNKYDMIFIRGNSWMTIKIVGAPFPMDKLLDRLKKILPGEEITLSDDNKIYLLGGKICVTEKGIEGKGPTADRVQKVYDTFITEVNPK